MDFFTDLFRHYMARIFTLIFMALSCFLTASALITIVQAVVGEMDMIQAFLKGINAAVVGLAMFELGLVVHKEYGVPHEGHDIVVVLRRTLPRFVTIACIALVLEGLLMVIKYSQLELAGNLVYPVAIVCSASVLLGALGTFLKLTVDNEEEACYHDPVARRRVRAVSGP